MGRGENDEGVSLVSIDRPASEAAGPPEERDVERDFEENAGWYPSWSRVGRGERRWPRSKGT